MFGWNSVRGPSSTFSFGAGSSRTQANNVTKVNDSVYEFYRPFSSPSMEIVFFHGLYLGDSLDAHVWTWESEDGSCLWPQAWLAEDFPTARVLSVSYFGRIGKGSNANLDMHIIGENLTSDLMNANVGQSFNCPLILVGHCFGGLVIKELCRRVSTMKTLITREREKTKLENFLDNVQGIFNYGTPHYGNSLIDKVARAEESSLLKYFSSLNKDRSRLNQHFDQLKAKYSNWQIDGLGESLPAKSGFLKGIIVAPEAAARQGDIFNILPVEHFTISKPHSKVDRRYYALTNLLKSIIFNKEVHQCVGLPNYSVDLERRALEVKEKLKDAEVLGIFGMGGLGKTTLAKQVFNSISKEFEYTCFVENAKAIQIEALRDSILTGLHRSGKKVVKAGASWLQLETKKTLIVVDDIDSDLQLKVLPTRESLGAGSRLIITSRNQGILSNFFEKWDSYTLDFLQAEQAERLFCQYAGLEEILNNDNPSGQLRSKVQKVIQKCGGLPLTLEVMGCYLRGRPDDANYWEETIDKLGRGEAIGGGRNDRVWDTLKVSYDGLARKEQKMFIDAASYFFEKPLEEAFAAWHGAYKNSETRWADLMRRSMVKEGLKVLYSPSEGREIEHKTVWVHEQLRDMATNLAKGYMVSKDRDFSVGAPLVTGDLLTTTEVAAEPRIVRVGNFSSESKATFQLDVLVKLRKLKYLDLNCVRAAGSFKQFPSKLSLLKWVAPFNSQPVLPPIRHYELRNLAVLELCNWTVSKELPEALGHLPNLRILSLSFLREFNYLPESFGNLSQLKKLTLEYLSHLRKLPASFGCLTTLQELCINLFILECLPDNFSRLLALKKLIIVRDQVLSDDEGFETLPETLGSLKSLEDLTISSSALTSLPDCLGELAQLKRLKLSVSKVIRLPWGVGQLSALQEFYFSSTVEFLPESFGQLTSLRTLDIQCHYLRDLPSTFGNLCSLQDLHINSDRLESLPDGFGQLSLLRKVSIGANKLKSLPEGFGQLSAAHTVRLKCRSLEKLPDSFGNLSSLETLSIICDTLVTLPDSIARLSSVTDLTIQSGALRNLPTNFGQLPALKWFRIFCSNLETLPDSIGSLSSLTELSVTASHLVSIPETLGGLSSLRRLSLTSGMISELPNSIGRLSDLHVLEITCDNLEHLPESFGDLPSLEHLLLQSGRIRSLPTSFGQLPALTYLNIECANLEALPRSFGSLVALQTLVICGSTLDSFQGSIDRLSYMGLVPDHERTKAPAKGLKKLLVDWVPFAKAALEPQIRLAYKRRVR